MKKPIAIAAAALLTFGFLGAGVVVDTAPAAAAAAAKKAVTKKAPTKKAATKKAATKKAPTKKSVAKKPAVKVVTYKNCAALNKVHPHGVGKVKAKDKVSGRTKPVTNFTRNDALYKANAKSDRDKDGIACEKR